MLPGEARDLKQVRKENNLKRIVADLTLDKVMLHDVVPCSASDCDEIEFIRAFLVDLPELEARRHLNTAK